jgi:large subunit ribosomal protein L25
MPEFVVPAESRAETGKNVNRRLRTRGLIPGVLYGKGRAPLPVAVSPKEITAILRSSSGENTLFDLEIGGARRKVILKEFQREPVRGQLLHADFYEVALDKPIEVSVPIELLGTPVGVKLQGGLVDFITRELDIECLPTEIPEKISVDISHLELGKHLRVSELTLPSGRITLLTEPDVVIVHVVTPRAEVEEVAAPEAAEAPAEGAEPEVARKGKAEGETAEAAAEAKPEEKKGERRERDKDRGRDRDRDRDRK